MSKSRIEWTEATWNPVTGCTPVSPACDHCYAARMARRLAGRNGYPAAPHQFDVTLHPERLLEPLRWRTPRRVFVCSMSDLFHPDVPDWFRVQVLSVINICCDSQFQILTKRPAEMKRFFDLLYGGSLQAELSIRGAVKWFADNAALIIGHDAGECLLDADATIANLCSPLPIRNLWLGVTAEDQQRADERIPLLLQTPAAVRFVSCEPLLGPVDLYDYMPREYEPGSFCEASECAGCETPDDQPCDEWPKNDAAMKARQTLDWVICGGETGAGARPMHPQWARSLRDQCAAAGVPLFFKGWGDFIPCGQKNELGWTWMGVVDPAKFVHNRALGTGRDPDPKEPNDWKRVGKKLAGRLLDGVLHEAYPEAQL